MKIHSIVDLITNSSTELFVVQDKTSIPYVLAALREKWEVFKQLYPDKWYSNKPIEDILEVHEAQSSEICTHANWQGSESIYKKQIAGQILIESVDDNSIPYEFWDVIEDLFHCNRYHLG